MEITSHKYTMGKFSVLIITSVKSYSSNHVLHARLVTMAVHRQLHIFNDRAATTLRWAHMETRELPSKYLPR